ncbi:hypothetical protein Plhal703r1_c11g0057221 [Plasmopara halstedii]
MAFSHGVVFQTIISGIFLLVSAKKVFVSNTFLFVVAKTTKCCLFKYLIIRLGHCREYNMVSMKGPNSETCPCSRVVPENETMSKTSVNDEAIVLSEQETALLAKLVSPVITQETDQVAFSTPTMESSGGLESLHPEKRLPHSEGNEVGVETNEETQDESKQADGVEINTIKVTDSTDEAVKTYSWKVVGSLAVLAKSMNAHSIDIYHDRKLNTSRFMIHPNSKLRRAWEIMTACLVLYVCVMVRIMDGFYQTSCSRISTCQKIPLIIGFQFYDWTHLNGMNIFIDVYFVTDMVMTLRTGIVSNGEVVMDPKKVAHKYLHSWFIVDLISNFPLVLFVQSSGKSLKIVKLQKIPKLLRIGRLLKYLREYAKYYNLIVSFLGLAMGLHLFACLWVSLFNECTNSRGEVVCTEDEFAPLYTQCVHIIMLMFLGIGESTQYASIAKLKNPETEATIELYYMSLAVFMLGTIFSSFLFGNVLALLMSWDQQKAQYRNRMDMIKAEMKYYELPEELQHRVRRNYDYLWINQRAYSDMMLLNQPGISKPLKTTIALHLYKDLLKTVPFFAGSDSRFLGKVCLALETAVYLPGDTIIYCDDIGKEMFIVRKGLVEILIPDPENSEKRIYLRDGNFFGETALVIDVRRTNTVRAVNICDLNVLSKHAFDEIAAEYPEFGERMKRTVIKRQLDNMNIQSPIEKAKAHTQLTLVVEKSLKQRRMSLSLRTIYRAKKLGDKLKDIADRASKPVHRLSRVVNSRQSRIRPLKHEDLQVKLPLESSYGGDSTRDFAQISGLIKSLSTHTSSYKRSILTMHRANSGPSRRGSSFNETTGHRRTLDYGRTDSPQDSGPATLADILAMVEHIRQTTELLSHRLGSINDLEDEDEDDYEYDDTFSDDMPRSHMSYQHFSPLTEESEDEMARRESNSIFVPDTKNFRPE